MTWFISIQNENGMIWKLQKIVMETSLFLFGDPVAIIIQSAFGR